MNRSRFNSPVLPGLSPQNSPDSNYQPRNVGLKESFSPDFIPFEYSSPLSSFKNNDNRNRRQYHRGSMRSFHSPQSGGSSFNSPYNSFGFNQSGDFRRNNFKHRSNSGMKPNSSGYSSKLYFNNSMIEDPWEDLEKQLREEKSIKILQLNTSDKASASVSDNDSDEESTKIEDEDAESISPDEKDASFSASTSITTSTTSTNSD